MTAEEFNTKYKDCLEEGHYGLSFDLVEATEYLDKEFQELIKIPNFKYSQIKSKFNSFRCYIENAPEGKVYEIETKLKEIFDNK